MKYETYSGKIAEMEDSKFIDLTILKLLVRKKNKTKEDMYNINYLKNKYPDYYKY